MTALCLSTLRQKKNENIPTDHKFSDEMVRYFIGLSINPSIKHFSVFQMKNSLINRTGQKVAHVLGDILTHGGLVPKLHMSSRLIA